MEGESRPSASMHTLCFSRRQESDFTSPSPWDGWCKFRVGRAALDRPLGAPPLLRWVAPQWPLQTRKDQLPRGCEGQAGA